MKPPKWGVDNPSPAGAGKAFFVETLGKKKAPIRHAYRYRSLTETGGNVGDFRNDVRSTITKIRYMTIKGRNREREITKGRNKRNAKSKRRGEFHDAGTRVCPAYRTAACPPGRGLGGGWRRLCMP